MIRIALMLVLGFACAGFSALAAEATLEGGMGVVVTVPTGWKVSDAKGPATAVSADGAVKMVVLYFDKQMLFEVANSDKLPANLAPALKDAKSDFSEKTVVNEMAGETLAGTGTVDGKDVRFRCLLIGDRDNKGNTLAVVVVGPATQMEANAKAIAVALESARMKGK